MGWVRIWGLMLLCGAALAQSPEERFDAAYRVAEDARQSGVEPAVLSRRYAGAVRAFLQVPQAGDAWSARLEQAAFAAAHADRDDLAREWFDTSWEHNGSSEFSAHWRLRVRARQADWDGFFGLARPWRDTPRRPIVAAELLAAASGAMPAAGSRLRRGEPDALTWFELLDESVGGKNAFVKGDLALACRHLALRDRCEREYRAALALAPTDGILWNDFGLFLRGAGRVPESLQAFRQSYGCDDQPGKGPGITNLVHMHWLAPELVPEPPLEKASQALRLRPEAAMLRRLTLDTILRKHSATGTDTTGR